MRVSLACCVLLCSTLGIAFAQDTNFSSGPQYLMNSDSTKNASPLFARSIATPSISLTGPPLQVGASNATGSLIAGAETQNVLLPNPDAAPRINLFPIFYGAPPASVIEISFPAEGSSNQLPASFLDTGVSQMTTVQALRERGFGLTFVEAAAYGRAQTRRATRVYTNTDIDRLHSGI
jgi:hypothetical protein